MGPANQNLKQQLLERMYRLKATAIAKLGFGPFGTGESREDFEKRIMNDESAWMNMNHKGQGILPR